MRIERLHIDRFGILAGQDVAPLSPGVNLFMGRNEAGKSTCLRFFQSMLFGYKRGNRSLDPMPQRGVPLSGGTLQLRSDSLGVFLLTRRPGAHGGVLTLADEAGRDLDEHALQSLFGGLTLDVFDSIFAFSLKNLMEFSSLKGDLVRHALHGAAFGLGLRSPAQVLKTLDDRMSALLKRDSASAAINNALRELHAVRGEAALRTPDMRQYADVRDRIAALEEGLEDLRSRRAAKERELHRVQRRRDIWRHWEEVRRIRSEKASLDSASAEGDSLVPRFAPDAVQRLDAILARSDEQRFSVREAELTCARLEADIAAIPFAPELAALHREAQTLREQKERRRGEAETYPQLKAEIEQLSALQEQTLLRLGTGWDAPRIAAVDGSIAVREQILRFEKALSDLEYAIRDKEREQQRLGAEFAEALAREKAAQKKGDPESAARTSLPDRIFCGELAADLARAEQTLEDLPRLREGQARTAGYVRLSLAAISPEWTQSDLRAFDDNPSTRQAIAAEGTALLAAQREAAEKERQAAEAQAASSHAQDALSRIEERLAAYGDLPDDDTLAARRELLDAMRQLGTELAAANREYEAAVKLSGYTSVSPDSAENAARKKRRVASLAASPLFVGGAQLFLGGTALMAGGWLDVFSPFLYAGGMLMLFGLLACLLQGALFPVGAQDAHSGQRSAEAQTLERRDTLARDFGELCRQADAWFEPGPRELPDVQALAGHARRLEQQTRQAALRERDRQDAASASLSCLEARTVLERAQVALEEARAVLRDQGGQWERALARLHLPAALPPDRGAAVFERVYAARNASATAREAASQHEAALARISGCLQKALAVPFFREALDTLASCGCAPDTAFSPGQEPGDNPLSGQERDESSLRRSLAALKQALDAAEVFREEERERLRELEALEERAQAREQAAERLVAAERQYSEAGEALECERRAWIAWLGERGFPGNCTPGIAVAMLDAMLAFAEREKELVSRKAREASVSLGLREFVCAVLALSRRAGLPPPQGIEDDTGGAALAASIPAVLYLLDTVAGQAENAARDAALIVEKQDRLRESTAVRERVRAALECGAASLAEMLENARVSDPEHFRAAFVRGQRKERLEAQERSLLAALDALAGEEAMPVASLLDSLEHTSLDDLEQESAALKEVLEAMDAEAAELTDERGRLRQRRQTLMDDQGSASLRRRESILKEDLFRLSRRWAVASLAREILLQAKRQLEETGQQGVIRYAGDIFAAITGGEYTGIAAGLEGDIYTALHHSGDRRDPEKQLSQGAREQLYLALRLAYVKNHADKAESVPLILDDILVNFDPQRAAATAKVLVQFSASNQLFFFTCHPGMAEMLLDAAGRSTGEAAAAPPAAFAIRKGEISLWKP